MDSRYLSIGTVYKFNYPPAGGDIFAKLISINREAGTAYFESLGKTQLIESIEVPIGSRVFYNVTREEIAALSLRELNRLAALKEDPDTPIDIIVQQEQANIVIEAYLESLNTQISFRDLTPEELENLFYKFYKVIGTHGTQICMLVPGGGENRYTNFHFKFPLLTQDVAFWLGYPNPKNVSGVYEITSYDVTFEQLRLSLDKNLTEIKKKEAGGHAKYKGGQEIITDYERANAAIEELMGRFYPRPVGGHRRSSRKQKRHRRKHSKSRRYTRKN